MFLGNLGTQENSSVDNPAHILNIKKDPNKNKSSSIDLENQNHLKSSALIPALKEHDTEVKNLQPNEELYNETLTKKSKTEPSNKEQKEETPEKLPDRVAKTRSTPMLVNYFDVYVKLRPMEEAEQHFRYLHSIGCYAETIQSTQV